MARDAKIEVSAINIRIPANKNRDYKQLIQDLYSSRESIQVYGESRLLINYFDPDTGLGVFSKYSEIDIDSGWFDIEAFEPANPNQLNEISIPKSLKPNLSQFYFLLNERLHILAFETYSESKNLSPRAVDIYFRNMMQRSHIRTDYGRVEIDTVKDYSAVTRILELPDLREIDIVIRRPNSDDLDDDLAKVIEQRLAGQNADEYQEVLRSKGGSIEPNDRTKLLAAIAAENGHVKARSLVNGAMVNSDTSSTPLREVMTYKLDEASQPIFRELARRVFERIRSQRAQASGS